MITVVRGPDRFRVTTLSWEAARVYAQQVGWRPSGAMGAADGVVQSPYGPGRPPDRDAHVAPRLALVRWAHGGLGKLIASARMVGRRPRFGTDLLMISALTRAGGRVSPANDPAVLRYRARTSIILDSRKPIRFSRSRSVPVNHCARTRGRSNGSGANGAIRSTMLAAEWLRVGNGQAEERGGAVRGSPLRPRSHHPVRALVSSIQAEPARSGGDDIP